MHLYAITRGHKPWVDKFVNDCMAITMPFEFTHPESKVKQNCVQLGVRAINLWEFVFPKDQKDKILATVLSSPYPFSKKQEWLVGKLRKLIGAKKVDADIKPDQIRYPVIKDFVECTPIGIREDKDHPTMGHEML